MKKTWKKLALPKLITETYLASFKLHQIANELEAKTHQHMTKNFPFLKGKQFKFSDNYENMFYKEPENMVQGDVRFLEDCEGASS